MHRNPYKIIELQDQYTTNAHQFPFIESVKQKIRFRLRSKLCYDHQPILLQEKPENYDYPLPLKGNINIKQAKTTQNFILLSGHLTKDGAWECDLPQTLPGVVTFQLVFVSFGSHFTSRLGTCDTILLCQDKYDLRKLRKMSVFARCIGHWSQWSTFFRAQKAIGYNAFHFAPIQETGGSNSYYSLKSHLQLSSQLFEGKKQQKDAHLQRILSPLKKQGMTFFIDIVLNHTSYDSQWIRQSSDCVFTVQNTPMLYPAYVVDNAIFEWGEWVKQWLRHEEFSLDILKQSEENLKTKLMSLKIYEYFQISPEFQGKLVYLHPASTHGDGDEKSSQDAVQAIQKFLHSNATTPNQNPYGIIIQNQDQWVNCKITYQVKDLRQAIQGFNHHWKNKIQYEWIPEMVENTIDYIKESYLVTHQRSFSDPYPLASNYFTKVDGKEGDFYALNNGWVGGDFDSRELFVTSKQHYYLRRRIHSWGDLIRIRYGNQPADSPIVWQHMLQYVREMARQFDGFRMDNLHGSPLNVAKHFIRQARKFNPNLVVFAELFTNSDAETAAFVREVGLDSTLLEAQDMLTGHEFVKNFHENINVVNPNLGQITRVFKQNGQLVQYAARKRPISLVYDITHDHLTFITRKMTILHTPLAYLLSMLGTFIGTTKGFDQFYSKKILVTDLRNLYQNDKNYQPVIQESEGQTTLITYSGYEKCSVFGSWNDWKAPTELKSDHRTHLQYAKLNLPPGKYEYKFTGDNRWILEHDREHNGSNHSIVVPHKDYTRKIYRTLQSLRLSSAQKAEKFFNFMQFHIYNMGEVIVVFRQPPDHSECICTIVNISTEATYLPSRIQLFGNIVYSEVWCQSSLSVNEEFTTRTEVNFTTNIHEYFDVSLNQSTGNDVLRAPFVPPGFACFIHCCKNEKYLKDINTVQLLLSKSQILPKLGPVEINNLFFCSKQEQKYLWGQEPFFIPQANHQLVYAGFAGVFDMIVHAKKQRYKDNGLFQNLRQGNWLLDYYLNRIRRFKQFEPFSMYLQNLFNNFKSLPRYLLPKYFTEFIYKLMTSVKDNFKGDSDFQKQLVFASCQFINHFPNIQLKHKTIFSANLSHFSGNWGKRFGRDTFTSSDLLKLYPNLFKDTIFYFASTLRHGLIPNSIDEYNWPRYNNRDTCWWFLKAIIDYIEETNDHSILKNKVEMIFLSIDKEQHLKRRDAGEKRILLLEEVVQEIFQLHANGINFREWEAGQWLDTNTQTEGFNINLYTDPNTGFIMGGNVHNCLTWMDKMGTSVNAGTKGVPATPRAGSPIELVGLLYFALTKFEQLNTKGHFSKKGVDYNGKFLNFGQWANKIKQNFQTQYYLEQVQPHQNRYPTGIYKDVVGSPLPEEEGRLRPNSLIALAVAPELFTPQKARNHIKIVEKDLLHPKSIGVATLADMYPPYASFYDLHNESNEYKITHGFSYHNGPQWVWLYGFYLNAKINFQREDINRQKMMALLQQQVKYLQKSQWQSLPELTNRNGGLNHFSSRAQAWSVSTILMALRKICKLPL